MVSTVIFNFVQLESVLSYFGEAFVGIVTGPVVGNMGTCLWAHDSAERLA